MSTFPTIPAEECQRADLGRYDGKTFRFHHGACWADVSIDANGKVTSFIPEDEEACREALKVDCGWMDIGPVHLLWRRTPIVPRRSTSPVMPGLGPGIHEFAK